MSEADQFVTQITSPLEGPVRFRADIPLIQVSSADQIASQLWLIVGIEVEKKAELHAILSSDPLTVVDVRYSSNNEGLPIAAGELAIVVTGVFNTSVQVRSELEQIQLDAQYLAGGVVTYRSEPHSMDEQWELSDDILEPVELGASSDFIELRDTAAKHLWHAGKQSATWLWWRISGRGKLTIRQGPLYCSLNGIDWVVVPTAIVNYRELIPAAPVDDSIPKDFATLADFSLASRFGRELLEESWSLRHSQPRSSLLLAIAAAEVGFKEWASSVAQDTGWLLENLQSPPLDRMLSELLPGLAKDKVGVELPSPMSKQLIVKMIKQGVEVRNTIAHAPTSSRRYKKAARLLDPTHFPQLQEIVLCVSDLLWLLDYLALKFHGREAGWALERVRPTSRTALGLSGNE